MGGEVGRRVSTCVWVPATETEREDMEGAGPDEDAGEDKDEDKDDDEDNDEDEETVI